MVYYQKNYQECLKRLSILKASQGLSQTYVEFFVLNSLGCINMNLKAPSIAATFFSKASQKSKQLDEESAKDWAKETKRAENISVQGKSLQVIKNLALAQYKLGNFSVAWKLFESVTDANNNDFMFWYRFAVCGFNWFMSECEDRTKKVTTL